MAIGEIPQSTALAEASAESLSDLLSRDPDTWEPGDWSRAIEAYRRQRVVWQQAEASGAKRAPAKRVASANKLVTTASAGELDL